jgi:leucyl aminopeptidase (aminopeptidase T)
MWRAAAHRIVQGLGVRPGELIQVRCGIDRFEVLLEILLAVETSGATPLTEFTPADYLGRLLTEAPADYLTNWDQHRAGFMRQYDRILVLQGHSLKPGTVPSERLLDWRNATDRLTVIEEERHLPVLVATIPTEERARQLGMTLAKLEEIVLPALDCSVERLQSEIGKVLQTVQDCAMLILQTGPNYILRLKLANRPWLKDDGYIDEVDRAEGAVVSNLPAGSIYTTVMEEATEGSLYLPKARQAREVIFHFEQGRITRIEAAEGAEELEHWLDSHSGEPRRISHIGIGLNPALQQVRPLDWLIVDEHIYGNLFLALGENRYMGGQNVSSLNEDFVIGGATLHADDRLIVSEGRIAV